MRLARSSIAIFAALIVAAQAGFIAHADDYPARPITLIAPWPPGGAVDTLCRILAAKLGPRLGKTVVVENRPGAGSVLGSLPPRGLPPTVTHWRWPAPPRSQPA
jgi:tripartite-type tricarboxylate transporter receptor subunit TctC